MRAWQLSVGLQGTGNARPNYGTCGVDECKFTPTTLPATRDRLINQGSPDQSAIGRPKKRISRNGFEDVSGIPEASEIGMRALVLIAIIYCRNGQSADALDLCALDANIETYKEHRIQLSAFIRETYENAFLYDPKCQDGKAQVHFVLRPNVKGKIKLLRKIVKKRGYAFATIEGIIHGPEPIQIDPKLADRVKDLYGGSLPMKGYGHLNAFKMEIEIENVLEAKEMDDGHSPGIQEKNRVQPTISPSPERSTAPIR